MSHYAPSTKATTTVPDEATRIEEARERLRFAVHSKTADDMRDWIMNALSWLDAEGRR